MLRLFRSTAQCALRFLFFSLFGSGATRLPRVREKVSPKNQRVGRIILTLQITWQATILGSELICSDYRLPCQFFHDLMRKSDRIAIKLLKPINQWCYAHAPLMSYCLYSVYVLFKQAINCLGEIWADSNFRKGSRHFTYHFAAHRAQDLFDWSPLTPSIHLFTLHSPATFVFGLSPPTVLHYQLWALTSRCQQIASSRLSGCIDQLQ